MLSQLLKIYLSYCYNFELWGLLEAVQKSPLPKQQQQQIYQRRSLLDLTPIAAGKNTKKSRSRLFETTASFPKGAKPSTYVKIWPIQKKQDFLQISLDIHLFFQVRGFVLKQSVPSPLFSFLLPEWNFPQEVTQLLCTSTSSFFMGHHYSDPWLPEDAKQGQIFQRMKLKRSEAF